MIIDRIENIGYYESVLPGLSNGLKTLKQLASLESGRHEFEGGFLMIQEGDTKPMEEGTFEAHRSYVDVQIMLRGCEELAWEEYHKLNSVIPYNEEKDQERLDGEKKHVVLISEGMFFAAFPQDGHKAVSHTVEQHHYVKAVMKLRIPKQK
ncbi:YhcH/YjgK/YiaL family protein [Clostridium sp. AF32-12BH]|uniref:YhcH/YjgK/YiaL family protein n=1 Tax=Clostridium sp. AF32-12BH TaxID=2292006 RepID=UPI000E531658|nr:YhcH/YjgK/YiaL family protein [Clostridium sp. AF32-12BH]RHP45002.1 DUF386 domain-containing protein [Clostridium sp. AF32-12BH]